MQSAIVALFVLSGLTGLTYQLVWIRWLELILGVSSQAIAAAVAAFMAGLALGSLLFGRLADRTRHPLRLYAALEAGIGLSALLMPTLFLGVNAIYVHFALHLPQLSWSLGAARFVLCLVAMLLPTTLMGGTLPAVSKFFITRQERLGTGAGYLYGANALGGILGTAATGFLLLRLLGSDSTTRLAVAANLLIVVVALLLNERANASRRSAAPTPQPVAAPENAVAPAEERESRHSSGLARFILIAFGLAGLASLAYEVLWTRVLVYFVGVTVYAFTTILAVFLLGIGLGSLAFARLADRVRNPLAVFGLVEIGIGISSLFLIHLVGGLLNISQAVTALWPSWTGQVTAKFVTAGALILLPTLLMGAAFPLATRIYTRSLDRLGVSLGNLYAANTIGSVAGSLVGTFLLLAWLGAQKGIVVVSVINLGVGAAAVLADRGVSRVGRYALLGSLPVVLVGWLLAWQVRPTITYSAKFREENMRLLYSTEGAEATLAVLATPTAIRELNINGYSTAFTHYADIIVHKMLGHLPVLLARDPQEALIIGFGLGSTAWATAQHDLPRVDAVELVPEEKETAAYFEADNHGILNDPRFHFIAGDGRNYLLTTTRNYDVISFNAIHPQLSPFLYTREFYELCRSRLRPGGAICAWVPTNTAYFRSLVATFQEVFPHSSLWFCNPLHTVLIGSVDPIGVSYDEWRARFTPAVRASLAEVHLDDPDRLLSTFLVGEAVLRRTSGGAVINTDDLPYVQFEPDPSVMDIGLGIRNLMELMPGRTDPRGVLAGPVRGAWPWLEAEGSLIRAWSQVLGRPDAAAIGEVDGALAEHPDDGRLRYARAIFWSYYLFDDLSRFAHPGLRQAAIAAAEGALPAGEFRGGSTDPGAARFLVPVRRLLATLYLNDGQLYAALQQVEKALVVQPQDLSLQVLRRQIQARIVA